MWRAYQTNTTNVYRLLAMKSARVKALFSINSPKSLAYGVLPKRYIWGIAVPRPDLFLVANRGQIKIGEVSW